MVQRTTFVKTKAIISLCLPLILGIAEGQTNKSIPMGVGNLVAAPAAPKKPSSIKYVPKGMQAR